MVSIIDRKYSHRILREGGFECQVCGLIFPLSMRREQDGLFKCTETCWRPMGKEETAAAFAEASRPVFVRPRTGPFPRWPNQPAITETTPREGVRATVGVESETITLSGVNLTSSLVSIDLDASLTVNGLAFTDDTSVEFTVTGSTPGDYDLVVNDLPLKRGFIRIRS
jgi:hypothetical protein